MNEGITIHTQHAREHSNSNKGCDQRDLEGLLDRSLMLMHMVMCHTSTCRWDWWPREGGTLPPALQESILRSTLPPALHDHFMQLWWLCLLLCMSTYPYKQFASCSAWALHTCNFGVGDTLPSEWQWRPSTMLAWLSPAWSQMHEEKKVAIWSKKVTQWTSMNRTHH